jgi:hypothetical protein
MPEVGKDNSYGIPEVSMTTSDLDGDHTSGICRLWVRFRVIWDQICLYIWHVPLNDTVPPNSTTLGLVPRGGDVQRFYCIAPVCTLCLLVAVCRWLQTSFSDKNSSCLSLAGALLLWAFSWYVHMHTDHSYIFIFKPLLCPLISKLPTISKPETPINNDLKMNW